MKIDGYNFALKGCSETTTICKSYTLHILPQVHSLMVIFILVEYQRGTIRKLIKSMQIVNTVKFIQREKEKLNP